MKTLLIDNYDSFTYNLYQLLAEANGQEPVVVRNDAASWEELAGLQFDNVVISPGPGSPNRAGDFGVCAQALRDSTLPLLGVCLGHQGLGWVSGAEVVRAPEARHGRISAVLHDDHPLFAGIPREFHAVRYHSLCLEQPLPDALRPIAWTSDGVLMALAHRSRPQWGVQFHPESICTDHGRRLLANFRDLSRELGPGARASARLAARPRRVREPKEARARAAKGTGLVLKVERLDELHDAECAFVELYGSSETAFWLDSSKADERARFSFMGAADGPLSATIRYDVSARELRVERSGGERLVREESIFDYLGRETARLREVSHDLPFAFDCGFVGYFGYELKADCEGDDAHRSSMPDAAFVFADRLVVFDHLERRTYLLCLIEPGGAEEADRWFAETRLRLASPASATGDSFGRDEGEGATDFGLSRSPEQYLRDIATCKQRLLEGETYEVCLTNKVTAQVREEPLELYRRLRRANPAPFSAYLRFGEDAILSSSPERFLRVGRDRWVEAAPIKGTSPRGGTPAEDVRLAEGLRLDEKSRAENLMIVDLLRNDLGSVCEVGTVHVPKLMHVETYETVHQLVSTVRGLLREGFEPSDCIRACFPGGSIVGAPKKRTMEIIDELEGEARGVYSGAIGYLGCSGGCDLSIAIRTIVLEGDSASLGVGGAIVMQSGAAAEYQETLLKAGAPMAAMDPGVDPQTAFEPPVEASELAAARVARPEPLRPELPCNC